MRRNPRRNQVEPEGPDLHRALSDDEEGVVTIAPDTPSAVAPAHLSISGPSSPTPVRERSPPRSRDDAGWATAPSVGSLAQPKAPGWKKTRTERPDTPETVPPDGSAFEFNIDEGTANIDPVHLNPAEISGGSMEVEIRYGALPPAVSLRAAGELFHNWVVKCHQWLITHKSMYPYLLAGVQFLPIDPMKGPAPSFLATPTHSQLQNFLVQRNMDFCGQLISSCFASVNATVGGLNLRPPYLSFLDDTQSLAYRMSHSDWFRVCRWPDATKIIYAADDRIDHWFQELKIQTNSTKNWQHVPASPEQPNMYSDLYMGNRICPDFVPPDCIGHFQVSCNRFFGRVNPFRILWEARFATQPDIAAKKFRVLCGISCVISSGPFETNSMGHLSWFQALIAILRGMGWAQPLDLPIWGLTISLRWLHSYMQAKNDLSTIELGHFIACTLLANKYPNHYGSRAEYSSLRTHAGQTPNTYRAPQRRRASGFAIWKSRNAPRAYRGRR